MSLRQAAEQALKVLEEINEISKPPMCISLPAEIDDTMETLRQALSKPKREWVGLTDQDIDLYAMDIGVTADKAPPWLVQYARDIEAKLKEKNT